jgi:dynamin 1-like protein
MQACYVNTTHPDFLDGHKAMAIVQDRLNPPKPPSTPDRATHRQKEADAINNNKNLDVDPRRDDSGFFGSFFSGKGKPPAKRAGTPVSSSSAAAASTPSTMEAPPAIIRPQAAFNDRETMETEVISKSLW